MLSPGPNNPSGFILTTVLGIAGAFLATFIGQAIGHYGPDQGAGFITATIGALVVLFIWNRLVASGVIPGFEQVTASPLAGRMRRACERSDVQLHIGALEMARTLRMPGSTNDVSHRHLT